MDRICGKNSPMKSSYVYVNGMRVHYLCWNPEGERQPIVLLHGLASNAHIWELVAEYLQALGYPLYAPEARGHGLSDKPEDGYSFEQTTRDLVAFLETCGLERPLLVGHSWGGALALDYAARQPIGARAPLGLVLVDGGMIQMGDMPGASWETISQRLAPPRLAGTPLDTFMSNIKQWNTRWLPAGEAGEQIASIYLASFSVDEQECITPQLSYERHMDILRAMWEFPTYERFAQLRCPVLMVPASPPHPDETEQQHTEMKRRGIEQARALIPQLQVHWMHDTIHDIPLQRPIELAGLIADFTTGLRASRPA
jgi:pimeloyl-ACP methyl ester carboxylesterase